MLITATCFDSTDNKWLCWLIIIYYNRLKATGHVMHNQFNIQQLYALPTLY